MASVDILPAARKEAPARRGARPSMLRAILRDRAGRWGLILIILVAGAAILAPWIAPHDPTRINGRMRLTGPSLSFLLGTDELGRDLLSRALYGARVSLGVSVTVVAFAGVIGVAIGITAGYFRGLFDAISMRVMDILFAFPTILLALALVATLGTDTRNLVIALAIVYIPTFARVSRGAALTISRDVYVEAARSVGVGDFRILVRHILPNAFAPIAVQASICLAYAILVESALSYLGLGVQPPAASWGAMLSTGKVHMETSLWPSLVPGLFIVLTVLGFNLLGDALRDMLDPKLRATAK